MGVYLLTWRMGYPRGVSTTGRGTLRLPGYTSTDTHTYGYTYPSGEKRVHQ